MEECGCDYCIAPPQEILRTGVITCLVHVAAGDGSSGALVLLVTHWDRPWSVWASDGTRHATLRQACGALQLPFGRLLVRDRQLGAVPVAALVGVAWRDAPQLPKWAPPTVRCETREPPPRVCGPACSPTLCWNPSEPLRCRLGCANAPGVLVRDWAPLPHIAVPMVRRRKTVPEWIAPPDERVEPSADGRPCALTAGATPVALWPPPDVAAYLGRSVHTHRGCSWVPGADLHLLGVLAARTRGKTGVLVHDEVLCEFQAAPGESVRMWITRSALAMYTAHWSALQDFELRAGSRFAGSTDPRPPGSGRPKKRKRVGADRRR